MGKKKSSLEESILSNIETHEALISFEKIIDQIIKLIYSTFKKNGKILICGNGGSAADAQHLVAELLVRLRPKVNRNPLPAIALAQDTSTITACGNDYSFEDIFLRNFQALSSKNDLLLAISTIIKVLKYAKLKKNKTIGFLGGLGGVAKKYCDYKIIVPNTNVARIQECHIFLGHYILEQVENRILNKKN